MVNEVILKGTVTTELYDCNGKFYDKFFQFKIECKRRSEVSDVLPVYVKTYAGGLNLLAPGSRVEITGVLHAETTIDPSKQKKWLNVFIECKKFKLIGDDEPDFNEVNMDGSICKGPNVRETLRGKALAEFIFEISTGYRIRSFVPCLCWNSTAEHVAEMPLRTALSVSGRLQSRNYTKRFPDGTSEEKVTYEVALYRVEEIPEESNTKGE